MLPSCESDWTTASSRATITKRNISQVASEWLVYVVSWHAWELTRHINSRFVMQLWLREVVKCVGYESSNNLGRQAELWERRTQIIIRSQKLREQKPKIDIASKEGRKSWHLSIYTGTPTKIDDKMQKGSWKLFGTCVPIYLLSLLTCENAGSRHSGSAFLCFRVSSNTLPGKTKARGRPPSASQPVCLGTISRAGWVEWILLYPCLSIIT